MPRPAPTSEISVTPAGLRIVYYDKSHRYKLGLDGKGEKLEFVPSVSTILDGALPKNLSGWVERITVANVLTLKQRGRPIERMGPDTILDELKAQNLRWWNTRDDAADRGTAVHKAFELLAEGTVPKLRDFPVEFRGYVQAMATWWLEFEPKVLHTELMVASWVHQYAGRMDLLAEVDGRVGVIDLKTSRAVRDSHHLQTAGYRIAVVESGYPTPDFGAILRVGEDGTHEYVYSHATPEQFLALRGSYVALKEFEKNSREIEKKEKKAA